MKTLFSMTVLAAILSDFFMLNQASFCSKLSGMYGMYILGFYHTYLPIIIVCL